jgi:hypothetical protein
MMSLVMGWLARTRLRARAGQSSNLLRHPRSLLIVGLVCSGFFLALAVLSQLYPGKSGSPAVSLTFLGFALLGVPVIAEYLRVRHELESDGLRYRPLLHGAGTLRWTDIRAVRYSHAAKWFRLETASGQVVRISVMLIGLPTFARAALEKIPATSIDPMTRAILEQTAAGSPPSIWS